jgi:hypothetical protein
MSFGGGGSGAAAITAHKHSNAAGEGGSLSTTDTLIESSNLYSRILVGA